MTINFGVLPVRASFTLSNDADFYQAVATDTGANYPVGATLQLVFLDAADTVLVTWSATIVTNTGTITQPKTAVAALLLLLPVAGRVYYQDVVANGPRLLVASGDIHDLSP